MAELDYDPAFFHQSRICKQQSELRCVWCDAVQGETRLNQDGEPYTVTIDGAHIHGYPKKHKRPRLVPLCKVCHRFYDNHGYLPAQE